MMSTRSGLPARTRHTLRNVIIVVVLALLLIVALIEVPSRVQPPTPPAFPASYTEQMVSLPGFDPLYGVVNDNNLGYQVPVLSSDSEQPLGIYYINNNSDLVEYSLANGSVHVVAPVTLLRQTYSQYVGMIPNEFTLAYGYDEALLFGADSVGALAIEAVNLTTGQVRLQDTGLPLAPLNQEVLLVGADTAIDVAQSPFCSERATDCPATIVGVNLTTGATWAAASLPWFEANNIYWVPEAHELVNVEAHGSTGDEVEQWGESAGVQPTFSLVSNRPFDHGSVINWVNGIGYRSGALVFSAGGGGYSATYIVTAQGVTKYVVSTWNATLSARLFNGQQYAYTGDWVMGGFINGTQYLFDPWSGTTAPTNEPFTNLTGFSVCDAGCFLGSQGTGLGWIIDFHASVALNDPFWTVAVAHET
jgi:hypothetical protein